MTLEATEPVASTYWNLREPCRPMHNCFEAAKNFHRHDVFDDMIKRLSPLIISIIKDITVKIRIWVNP